MTRSVVGRRGSGAAEGHHDQRRGVPWHVGCSQTTTASRAADGGPPPGGAPKKSCPALLFNNVIGAYPGLRAMGAPAATSRQPGHYLARLAMMMGHDPLATGLELAEAYVEAKSRPVLAPIQVSRDKAPCSNVMLGEDVDLMRFPVPYIHDGDGGRYIQTAGVNIVRSPDGTWTNWSVNRSMLVDNNHLTGLVIPEQHIGIVHGMWKQEGKPTPWALALGAPPAAMLAAGAPMPAYVNEHDFVSQLTGAPVELVKCETVDVEAPATAEIVLEGFISDTETAMEGPLGEYGGYTMGEPEPWPLFTVTAVTYRDRAILPVIAPGRPVEDVHTIWGLGISAETLDLCRKAQLPVTACWIPLDSATHWMVVTVPDSWHDDTGQLFTIFCTVSGRRSSRHTRVGSFPRSWS